MASPDDDERRLRLAQTGLLQRRQARQLDDARARVALRLDVDLDHLGQLGQRPAFS